MEALAQTETLRTPEGESLPGVLVGVPSFGVVYAATVDVVGQPMPLADKVIDAGDCHLGDQDEFGGGLAVGDLDGDGSDEWIVRAWDQLCVFESRDLTQPPFFCHLSLDCPTCNNIHSWDGAVGLGRLLSLPGGRSTVVFGLVGQQQGKVHFLGWTAQNALVGAQCTDADVVRFDLTGPVNDPSFGRALLVEDFDGDGWDELFVSAPEAGKVYVYSMPGGGDAAAWQSATPSLTIEPDNPADARAFGQALVLADLDGDGTLELAVSDPDATVGGETMAGRVFVFSLNLVNGSANQLAVFEEPEEGKTHHFGKGLSRVVPSGGRWSRSGGQAHQLVIGSDEGAYLFLETGVSGDLWPIE